MTYMYYAFFWIVSDLFIGDSASIYTFANIKTTQQFTLIYHTDLQVLSCFVIYCVLSVRQQIV